MERIPLVSSRPGPNLTSTFDVMEAAVEEDDAGLACVYLCAVIENVEAALDARLRELE